MQWVQSGKFIDEKSAGGTLHLSTILSTFDAFVVAT